MAQEKPFQKPEDKKNPNQDQDKPKTFGKEPPMEDPKTPEHPGEYEVTSDSFQKDEKPTYH